ncbi:D-2-hydroxyacid dehydrogenase [Hoeflea sp. CAU 1731]
MRFLLAHPNPEPLAHLLQSVFPKLDLVVARDDVAPRYLQDVDILLTIGRWLTAEHVVRASRLRWIQCLITGTEHIEPLLRRRPDVLLTNARGIHGAQMTEAALTHMLVLIRQVPRLLCNQKQAQWQPFTPRVLEGKTAVILGSGAIAQHMARVLSLMDMRVLGVSAAPRQEEGFQAIVARSAVHVAVAEADFVINLLPMSEENRHFVDARFWHGCKRECVFINLGRGGTVDTSALIGVLKDGKISAAGLDAFELTPLPTDSPLWTMPNVFITPGLAGRSDNYDMKLMSILEANIPRFLHGEVGKMVNRVLISIEY